MTEITADSPFLGVCRITRAGFVAALEDYPANAGLLNEREPGQYWEESRAFGVDPLFLLSMIQHESSMGTAGSAVDTFSWGNTRSPSFGAIPYDLIAGRSGSFPAFSSWLEGCASTVARLSSLVWPVGAPYGERSSIREVFDHPSGAVWAPSSDLNDPDSYLSTMLTSMNSYCDQEEEWIAATRTVVPPVYSDYLSVNYTPWRENHSVKALVLHVTQGASASSCIGWFQNPASGVSSHVVVDRDGTIYLTVREQDQAWVNGVLENENTDIPIIDHWSKTGTNPNLETLGLEVAGYSSMAPSGQPPHLVGYTEAQFDALAYLLPVLAERHGLTIDPDTVFGHCEISGTQRVNCPGLSAEEWQRVYSMGTPTEPEGPYDTADEAYDAYCQEQQDVVIWAGEIRDKGHWYSRNPQEVSRTVNNRLLAYDGGYAQDAGGWQLDEWQEAAKASGQLAIYGEPPPAPPDPGTPGTPDPPGPPSLVGAAWPINPGDGATDVATDVTLQWGSDAPTSDVEFEQSDGVRIFALQAHPSTAYGPLELAEATTYVWRVRGRDSGNVSDWTAASFGTAHPVPETPDKPDTPDKPASGEPYPPVVSPTHAEQPAATTWVNVKSGRTDYAVSERWRPDGAAGGGDWPDSAQHCDPSYPGREDPDPTWLDIRKLTRRLSMMPAISEALLRAGMFERVPATEDPCSRDWWAEGASEDWGDECSNLPQHVHVWASRLCTLGLALGAAPTVWQAFVALGFSEAEGHILSSIYHCLRRRCRDMSEIAHC